MKIKDDIKRFSFLFDGLNSTFIHTSELEGLYTYIHTYIHTSETVDQGLDTNFSYERIWVI